MAKKFLNQMIAVNKELLQTVIRVNEVTERFGLSLTEVDAKMLLEERKKQLHEQERVEFGKCILPELIFTFCDSPYIEQDNFADTMATLQEIFYRYKNETMDEYTDDEILEFMKDKFDGTCEGDIDYLEGTFLEQFARNAREKKIGVDFLVDDFEIEDDNREQVHQDDDQEKDFIPIVAKLADFYTGKASTSVSYATARQLMGAVQYCIREVKNSEQVEFSLSKNYIKNISAEDVYQRGKELVIEKVLKARELYDDIIEDFCDYKNEALQDTILKGMPAFFLHYDVDFAPQNTILTLDYPTIQSVHSLQGIDAIYEYLRFVSIEQRFLKAFPTEYVIHVLSAYHDHYEELLINLTGILLRDVIGKVLCNKEVAQPFTKEDYRKLKHFCEKNTKEELYQAIIAITTRLFKEQFKDDEMCRYMQDEVQHVVAEYRNAYEFDCLERIFVYSK